MAADILGAVHGVAAIVMVIRKAVVKITGWEQYLCPAVLMTPEITVKGRASFRKGKRVKFFSSYGRLSSDITFQKL